MRKGPNKQKGEKGHNTGRCTSAAFTRERKQAYCAELAVTGLRSRAVLKVGVSMQTVSNHYTPAGPLYDPEFHAAVEDAKLIFRQSLVAELLRRGRDGVDKPVFQGGELVGHVREYSDSLLTLAVKRFNPEFRDSLKVDQKTTIKALIDVDMGFADLTKLPREARLKLREALDLARLPDPGPEADDGSE